MDVGDWNYISIHSSNNLPVHICWCINHWLIYFQLNCLSQNSYLSFLFCSSWKSRFSICLCCRNPWSPLLPGVERIVYLWECEDLIWWSHCPFRDPGKWQCLPYVLSLPMAYCSCSIGSFIMDVWSLCLKWDLGLCSAPWCVAGPGADFPRTNYPTVACWWD